ncbi:MAG: hypothetical protein AAB426_14195, partial [Myxococcota bacterium]
ENQSTASASPELTFGTSGLRGLVTEMTDREVFVNTLGFLRYLERKGDLTTGDNVALAEDLRARDPRSGLSSSPRIAAAVVYAIRAAGATPSHCGQIPTPALAHYAMACGSNAARRPMASIMVTGSHIPADRNGVKFYRPGGEVLKAEEPAILAEVRRVRSEAAWTGDFDAGGMLLTPTPSSVALAEPAAHYVARYLDVFGVARPLVGKHVVVYQHSAVGRDLLVRILEGLGATVIAVGRRDEFVAVDTEDVTVEDEAFYADLVRTHRADALVSTDGDGDRPLLVDEKGRFHRGDVVGIVTARFVGASVAAVPVSVSDAVDRFFAGELPPRTRVVKTRIGSPYVIEAMSAAIAGGATGVVAWEANGGFLTATDCDFEGRTLTRLPTRDAMLPILAVLISAARERVRISELFSRLPQRSTRAGLIDDVAPPTSGRILAHFHPRTCAPLEVRFRAEHIEVQLTGDESVTVEPSDPRWAEITYCRKGLERYFPTADYGAIDAINYVDGTRVFFAQGDICHLRASGNAPQFRLYTVADSQARADGIIAAAIGEPGGILRRMQRELAPAAADSLRTLRRVVDDSQGPRQALAIVNGGDQGVVEEELRTLAPEIFCADGAVQVMAHEETTRRGQLLGLLDAVAHWEREHGSLDPERVAVGLMMPGKGTRLSPLTQRLHGIKPFLPTLVRHRKDGQWLSAAAASLYSWSLVTHHLERMGFRGIAWKWGDEPQLPASRFEALHYDLSHVDAVRFGAELIVADELAEHKEWLFRDPESGLLVRQLRRRPRLELLRAMGIQKDAPVRALVHIGSPAFSHLFVQEARAVFGDLAGALDVDGYLFEALTSHADEWQAELRRDAVLARLVGEYPDFYARVTQLRQRLEDRRGHALAIQVIDFGADLYWGDVGQLEHARRTLHDVAQEGVAGTMARLLACIDDVPVDGHGNRLVGDCILPSSAQIRNSVLIDVSVSTAAVIDGAVVVESQLGEASLAPGSVAVRCTAGTLTMGPSALAFELIGETCDVPGHAVRTSICNDPSDLERGLATWSADLREDPGTVERYNQAVYGNPASFADKLTQMRQRAILPQALDTAVTERFRTPVLARLSHPPAGSQ